MQYARLGCTGITVSRLCLGTMTFGLQADEAESRKIMDLASEGGINFIDTADVYPLGGTIPTVGRTEEIVGRWLKGKRQNFILATKAVGRTGNNPWDSGASRKHLLDAIDDSLRRLDTDYVDLYQLHSDDSKTPIDETLEALDLIVRSGKARYIGVSNFLAYRLARALGRSEYLRVAKFISVQPRYSLLFREIERELLPLCEEEKLAVISFNPLAGGLLTGKHRLDGSNAAGTRFADDAGAAKTYKSRYWHETEFATIDALRGVVDPAGHKMTTVAVAWVLANPVITSALIGASRADQLADNLAAIDFKLDAALKQQLDEITLQYRYGDSKR